MPFFRKFSGCRKNAPYAARLFTLQVRMPGDVSDGRTREMEEKGAWMFSSGAPCAASVSVEAALSLSVFIFAMVCMMYPFRMMERQRQVQAALESVNERLCQYAYLEYMLTNGEELPKEDGDWKEGLILGLADDAAKEGAKVLALEMFDQEGMSGLSFAGSSFREDGETSSLCLDYQMDMPFSILGLNALPFSSGSIRRAWIGREGRTEESGGEDKSPDQVVYVGKTSSRYHLSRECHYLSNKLQSVPFDDVSSYRNQDGGKYYPCAVCAGGAESGDTVYIMKSGSRYHANTRCTAITSYIRAVRLSEVQDLGPCSYCGR